MASYKVRKAVLAVAILTLLQVALGQHKAVLKVGSPTKTESAQSANEQPSGRQEGIEVHGHWTITIRNPDGSVSSRHEFENSLQNSGQKFLVTLLAGQAGQFNWVARIGSLCGKTRATPCTLSESAVANMPAAVTFFGEGLTPALSVSVPTTGTNSGKLVFSGSVTASYAGQITTVDTDTVVPSGTQMLFGAFTGTTLSQAIAVQTGQIIDVTVVISFS